MLSYDEGAQLGGSKDLYVHADKNDAAVSNTASVYITFTSVFAGYAVIINLRFAEVI